MLVSTPECQSHMTQSLLILTTILIILITALSTTVTANHAPSMLARCGNGVITTGEQCDDGNRNPGDGCSPQCMFEDTCGCAQGINFICEPHTTYGGILTVCCPTLINPVTNASVCHCRHQQAPTQYSYVTHDCLLLDINECEVDNGGCHENAICSNTDGRIPHSTQGRICICPEGLFGDGISRCETQQLLANFVLAVRNLSNPGNFVETEWISEHILDFTIAYSWVDVNNIVRITSE